MTDLTPSDDNEIELIDILRVLWKWKFLIIIGTVICGAASVLYSLSLPRVYRAEMTIQPGVLKFSENGERVYVNSLKSISGRVKAGVYDLEILSNVVNKEKVKKEEILRLGLDIPAESNVLKVSYETTDLKEGSAVLNYLFKSIAKDETELLNGLIENYNYKIDFNKNEIEKVNELIKSYEKNVKVFNKRISEINNDIEKMNKNSLFLTHERKNILERKSDEKGSLSVLLYSNTIQQNIQFVNRVKKDLNDHQTLKEIENQKIILEKDKQKKIQQETFNLEKERDGIKKMKILIKPEDSSDIPVKPRRSVILLIGLIGGFSFLILCSFLAEYIVNNKITEKGSA